VVFCSWRDADAAQQPAQGRRRGGGVPAPREISAWLHIAEDGAVTVYTGKTEVGQNIRTSLTQAVCDELSVPPESVTLVMADTARTPFDAGTFGSRTTPSMAPQLRRAAAAAREVLIDLAAKRWDVGRQGLVARGGKVEDPGSNRALPFGELTRGEKLQTTIDENTPTTTPDRWTVAGRKLPRVDGRAFVTGRHAFASDIQRPNMLHGVILRPPALGGTLASVDTADAENVANALVVREGDFIGVAAPDELTARRALARLKPAWKPNPPPGSHRDLAQRLRQPPERSESGRDEAPRESPSAVRQALDASPIRIEATYEVAYIAHAPLEPRAAVAEWEDGRLTVWTGTQRPFGVRGELARAFELPEDRIRVIVPDTGAGYGGKHTGEAALEAARLARAVRRPVKVVWTREEEFKWAYFRPAGVIDAAAGASSDGALTAWEFHNCNSGGSGLQSPYRVSTRDEAFHPSNSPLRQGSYRALASTANHFARESLIDELAHAAHVDPLEFRLKNLDNPRVRAVLEAAADRFDWASAKSRPERGFGLACGTEKGGYIATCAEVAIDPGTRKVQVVRLVAAFECGAIVNPDGLANQVEGSLVQGLGGALFEAIRFEDGVISNGRFSRYRVPRFSDLPKLDVVLLDRTDLPSAGGGESPIVAVAPAIANAIFNATGSRLRSLPLVPNGTVPA
jgi:isoquinoline 1-oxidoreductase